MGFRANGNPEWVDLGDFSAETCFVDPSKCQEGTILDKKYFCCWNVLLPLMKAGDIFFKLVEEAPPLPNCIRYFRGHTFTPLMQN